MKRLFAILVAATAILSATAQLKVTGSGHVQVELNSGTSIEAGTNFSITTNQ